MDVPRIPYVSASVKMSRKYAFLKLERGKREMGKDRKKGGKRGRKREGRGKRARREEGENREKKLKKGEDGAGILDRKKSFAIKRK